ncbi:PREDICTED: glutaredoxin-like [Ipomoea nil]|uniref:glutaredoxin-like n=1 Tax=Ipomoea nil TaxID=35883 RepID=UPI00090186E2|nr:PREDICTED: glutaredoxin-like [Ipomoea nil]
MTSLRCSDNRAERPKLEISRLPSPSRSRFWGLMSRWATSFWWQKLRAEVVFVASNPVVVFSKSYCPFCVDVKKLLTQLGASFKAIELDTESDGSEIQSALAEWTGQRTVPNVFIGGKHIGGCDKTIVVNQEGKLVPLLTEAGALSKAS